MSTGTKISGVINAPLLCSCMLNSSTRYDTFVELQFETAAAPACILAGAQQRQELTQMRLCRTTNRSTTVE